MLVLTRKTGQSIVLPSIGVTITVEKKWGTDDYVSIGIDAPRDIAVHRSEVWDTICRERNGKAVSDEVD